MSSNQRQTHRPSELVTGAGQGGQALFSFKHTHVGAADVVAFADYDMPNMADADYRIAIHGESTESAGDAISADESSITAQGFTFVGGTASEISHVWIHGKVEGTPEA